MFFNNSVDPDSENYQGYKTIDNVDNFESIDSSGNYNQPPVLVVTKLKDAKEYIWKFSKKTTFGNYVSANTSGNEYDPISVISEPGLWYWKAKVRDSNGEYSDWSEIQDFELNSFKLTYEEKNLTSYNGVKTKTFDYFAGKKVKVLNPDVTVFENYGMKYTFQYWEDDYPTFPSKTYNPGDNIEIQERDMNLIARYYQEYVGFKLLKRMDYE